MLGLLNWPSLLRAIRAQALSLRERDFIAAARALDLGLPHIIFRELSVLRRLGNRIFWKEGHVQGRFHFPLDGLQAARALCNNRNPRAFYGRSQNQNNAPQVKQHCDPQVSQK